MKTSSRSYLIASDWALFVHGSIKAHLISEINHARHKGTLVDTHDSLAERSKFCLVHNKLQDFK